jgi:hypothetical protein
MNVHTSYLGSLAELILLIAQRAGSLVRLSRVPSGTLIRRGSPEFRPIFARKADLTAGDGLGDPEEPRGAREPDPFEIEEELMDER